MRTTHRYPRIICLFLFGISISSNDAISQSVGTSVCFVRTQTDIYVGADSKRIIEEHGLRAESIVCKIQKVGKSFIIGAGMVSYDVTQFDILRTARDNITGAIPIDFQIAKFDNALLQSVHKTWKYLQHNNPQLWSKMVNGLPPTTVMVFGFKRGIPYFFMRQYLAIKDSIHNFTAIDYINEPEVERNDTAMFSNCSEPLTHLMIHGPIPNFIDSVIAVAIRLDSATSGHPIDILHLDNSGEHWIRRKQMCE